MRISQTACDLKSQRPLFEAAMDRLFLASGRPLLDLLEQAQNWDDIERDAKDWKSRFDHLIVIGIGGSSLGAQVLCSLQPQQHVSFIENVDPFGLDAVLSHSDLNKTCFAFVSKSGRTIEILAILDYLREILIEKQIDLFSRSLVMTAFPESPLGLWAQKNKVILYDLPENVSGRFSVFSRAGLFPAAFAGVSLTELRLGAKEAWRSRSAAIDFMMMAKASFDRQEWISLFWFYEYRGRLLGAWLQQLWAESLAKKTKRSGEPALRVSTPLAAIGTVDQHSLLQQVAEGEKDKWVVFFRFTQAESGTKPLKETDFSDCQALVGHPLGRLFEAEAHATEQALSSHGISTAVVQTSGYCEKGIGQLLMFFQIVVAGLGEFLEIDPFNQPGVELGKILAQRHLARPSS